VFPGAYGFALVDPALSSSSQSQKSIFTHDTTTFKLHHESFRSLLVEVWRHNTLFYFSICAEATFVHIIVPISFRAKFPAFEYTTPQVNSLALAPTLLSPPIKLERHGMALHLGEHVSSRGSKVTQRMHSQVKCR
jgi:hypothetical protein